MNRKIPQKACFEQPQDLPGPRLGSRRHSYVMESERGQVSAFGHIIPLRSNFVAINMMQLNYAPNATILGIFLNFPKISILQYLLFP